MADVTRRDLVRSLAVLGAAPVLLSTGCARRVDPPRTVAAPEPVDGVIDLPADAVPELATEGGAVGLDIAGSSPLILVAAAAGKILALDGLCTHAQCPVTWIPEDKQLECPCHGSRFASDGSVLNAPAVEPLFSYPVDSAVPGRIRVVIYPGDGTFPAIANGKLTLDLSQYPALQQDGGVLEGRAQGFPDPIIVRNLGGELRLIDARCPHLGCQVHELPTELRCFCHDSRFEPDGTFIDESGPANKDLAHTIGVVSGNIVEFPLPA